jgi:histone acetyltransferase MYST1
MELSETDPGAQSPNADASGTDVSAALSVDTSETGLEGVASEGANNSSSKVTPKSAATTAAMDNHPYARGAVIEVLHGVKETNAINDGDLSGENVSSSKGKYGNLNIVGFSKEDEDWWNEDSDEDEEKKENDEDTDKKPNETSSTTEDGGQKVTVRLCDIIDRVQVDDEPGKYRYYVHYRDFNRRMDEWISMERIVSPPSVGNAKARAIKREEEKRKKQQQREEEKRRKEAEQMIVDVSAPRASRRRTTAGPGGASTPVNGADDGEGDDEPRRRARRRNADAEDEAYTPTGAASGAADGEDAGPPPPVMAAEKGVVALPTAAASTKVGEHVVQTIAAQELDEHEGLDDEALKEHEEVTKVKNVAFVELGPYQMETWYFSPLPKELLSERGLIEVLYVCEFTFNMFSRKSELRRFQSRLPTERRHPPGNEIYRKNNLSMFEVDGAEERIYCQNLCYIAKLFLDHKTLYFDVDPFLFYVLCEVDDRGFHPVGYYSKEKYSDVGYNLACILTFPSHQRKGYGRFLIAFSYELSKKEEKVGSPEKPMSDLGQQAYKPYWASTVVDFLLNQCPDASSLSIMDVSKKTSIMAEDIVFTLNQLSLLKIINGVYFIAAEEGLLRTLAKKYPVKEPRVDPSKLHWTPFITDVKRDKFSIHSKKPSVEGSETRGAGGF